MTTHVWRGSKIFRANCGQLNLGGFKIQTMLDSSRDHSRALYASTIYWSAQALEEKTRPAETDLVTNDLWPLNLGLATAQRRAQNRTAWQTLEEMATSLTSSA